jgi:hypothetical protein
MLLQLTEKHALTAELLLLLRGENATRLKLFVSSSIFPTWKGLSY